MEVVGVGLTYRQRHAFFRHSSFEALKDISFEIRRGETLGIVGKNGSGKSTLLRVLSGIYKPDRGKVIRHCESVSLLSLGIGFDQHLSGRSNAMILGMFLGARKSEVLERLEEIIEFSELGPFADQPLKTYSSGMRARLGFSVAVTMRADLLLIDEVLSVGDAGFKQKAEAAMVNRITSEQSVALISHSIGQVRRLCDRVLWLDDGRIREIGDPGAVTERYLEFFTSKSAA